MNIYDELNANCYNKDYENFNKWHDYRSINYDDINSNYCLSGRMGYGMGKVYYDLCDNCKGVILKHKNIDLLTKIDLSKLISDIENTTNDIATMKNDIELIKTHLQL